MKYSKPVAVFPSIATGRVMYHIPGTRKLHRQEWKVKRRLFCGIYFSKTETRDKHADPPRQPWIPNLEPQLQKGENSSFLFLSRTLSLILVDKSKRGKLLGEFQKRKKNPHRSFFTKYKGEKKS